MLTRDLATVDQRWEDIEQHAQEALAIAERLGSPVWSARIQADLAEALDLRARAGDGARAATLWCAALAEAERLGMPGLVQRCRARLDGPESRVPAAPAPATPELVTLERAGELWFVRGFGEQVHVKDSRGMFLLARLLQEPGRELHVLDLVGSAEGGDGDLGPAIDEHARAAYRERIRVLRAERDEAECAHDLGRRQRAAREIEALSGEIQRAFGLGGRARKTGTASARARSNAQRRISHALTRIQAASPRLGEHLAANVKTGTFCGYTPAAIDPRSRRP